MEKLLTEPQIAEHLGVRTSTIYQWTHQEFIPHVKLGKLVRFRECDVVKWLEDRLSPGNGVVFIALFCLTACPV